MSSAGEFSRGEKRRQKSHVKVTELRLSEINEVVETKLVHEVSKEIPEKNAASADHSHEGMLINSVITNSTSDKIVLNLTKGQQRPYMIQMC